ncbi:10532_t:CDS:2 [Rhizophagus irregularis]|nr:10532_t:CDS:2 [Rhizophagus irregularis]
MKRYSALNPWTSPYFFTSARYVSFPTGPRPALPYESAWGRLPIELSLFFNRSVADSPSKSAELNHLVARCARTEALCLDALLPYVREQRRRIEK